MKGAFSIVRWKFVLPVAIFVGAVIVFFIFFFDPIAARVIENVGSRINGAKVEVDGFKTKFLQGRVQIGRLQVANKTEPMQNIVEAGPLAFQTELSELISKRVIINEATLSGLQFNTPRKTSGALPKRLEKKVEKNTEPSATQKLTEKYKDRFKLNLDGMKGDVKSKIDFKVEDLQLTQKANELKEMAEDVPAQWDKSIEELNAEARLKKIEEDLKLIKETPTSGAQALTAIPEALGKLKKTKEELDQLKNDANEVKQTAVTQLNELKNAPKALMNAKKGDVDNLMARFNLDFADPDRLVEGLIGPTVLSRFQNVFRYIEIARKHMPSQKEKASLPEKPRATGMDIEFPTPAALPRFWLMKASLDGAFEDVGASGTLTNLTTDPTRVGKPFRVDMDGRKGVQKFFIQGLFDHVGDNSKDSISLQANGFDVAKLNEGSDNLLSGGTGSADLAVSLLGDNNIGGQVTMTFTGLKLNNALLMKQAGNDALKSRFVTDVVSAIEKTPLVQVNGQIYGTWADPNLKLSSNLGSVLSNVIKNSIGNLVADQRKQLDARLDQVFKDKTSEVQAKANGLDEKLNGKFGPIEKKIQEMLNDATGIKLGGGDNGGSALPIPNFKKLFKK